MKKLSLTLKITIAFIMVSMATLFFLYFVFYNLFEERMMQSEREKATLIAQTIEPMIGLDYYLGLNDEIQTLAASTIKSNNLGSIEIIINDKAVFSSTFDHKQPHIHISYPIKDPTTSTTMGNMDIVYKLDGFYKALHDVKSKILYYLAALGFAFIIFAFATRYLLNPLSHIAKTVQSYTLGSEIDFSSIRVESETSAIINAFKRMLANIREYTILLERYKHSVDESSIVSKTDLSGRITYINDEFCRVSGYTRDELIGSTHKIVSHPDMTKSIYDQIWRTLLTKNIWKGTLKNQDKSGNAYYIKITIVPILDEQNNLIEYMGISHDITQIIKQQEQIARQTTDLITGLPNRIKLEEDLKEFISPKFALVELDNFHIIKDYYGNEIGNQTLSETAQVLQEFLLNREVKIYKLSSSEFGLLVGENVDVTLFLNICSDVIKKIDDYVVHIQDNSFNIHATAGITYSQSNLLTNASLALRHAHTTRKSSILYEETDNLIQQYENNLFWTKSIKSALQDNRIVIFAQPIVNAKTLQTTKYECLVRLIDEEGKIVSPYHFLEIAKKSKIYNKITKKVIEIAFETFSKIPDIEFSINLCVEDLLEPDTIKFLRMKLTEFDIASRLVLEIVESEGIEDYNEVTSFITDMKQLGCKISIDDFGTGYSNFAYLLQLNVDYIKIDGSLIKNIDHDPNSQIISSTILDFARQLELKTVAEFVHNETVLKHVQNMGFDYVQGFHLSEPISIEEVITRHFS